MVREAGMHGRKRQFTRCGANIFALLGFDDLAMGYVQPVDLKPTVWSVCLAAFGDG